MWDPRFTIDAPDFLVTYDEKLTKTEMIKQSLGIALPDECNEVDILRFNNLADNCCLWISSWAIFQTTATSEQVGFLSNWLMESEMTPSHADYLLELKKRLPHVIHTLNDKMRRKLVKAMD